MSTPKKPRCFVAMAFGYDDTNHIYDKWIKPSIEEVGLVAVRVDKIIHNERIDAKIRDEILKADILIADLTYARPSVYWEAGYAERQVPVIYTCRKDHFPSSLDKKTDTMTKVHFDLANANILSWSGNGNKSFGTNLTKRIRFVTKELRIKKEQKEKLKNKRISFSQKSLIEKAHIISMATIATLLQTKYKRVKFGTNEKDPADQSRLMRPEYGSSNGLFWKIVSTTGILISAHSCHPKVFADSFRPFMDPFILSSIYSDRTFSPELLPASIRKRARDQVNSIRQIKIIPVIPSLSDSRIQSIFTMWRNVGLSGWYIDPRLNSEKRKLSNEIIFIPNIKSIEEFITTIKEILSTIEEQR